MVDEELDDGVRIAELLASELTGRGVGAFADVTVENADLDVEPTEFGERAYDVHHDGEHVASVFVHPDRAHVEFRGRDDGGGDQRVTDGRADGLDDVRDRAADLDLRVRPKATQPPRLLVFVGNGAEVKRVIDVVAVALQSD